MKKFLIIIISLLMILCAGCRKKTEVQPVTSNPYPLTKDYKPTEPEPVKPAETTPTKVPETKPSDTTPATTTPKQATTTPAATEPAPAPQSTMTIYKFIGIDGSTTIKNNPKFKVSLSTLTPKAGDTIKVKIETEQPINIRPFHGEVYGNGNMLNGGSAKLLDDKKTFIDTIAIQNWPTFTDNTVDIYVFVTNQEDKTTSEYKFKVTVQK